MWPEIGRPGPEIGFLQECVRWWDEHLKGRDTGIMDEPMLRAWMQEPVAPAPDYDERPGRWVAEAAWPGRDEPPLAFVLDAEGLTAEPTGDAALVHTSPQTVGLDAGAWCAYGNPADIPVDQRRDDARSLTFDSAPVAERFEMLGQPIVTLRVSADRPRAFVAARLCDVAPGRRVDDHHPRLPEPLPSRRPRARARRPGRRAVRRAHRDEERRLRRARRAHRAPRALDELLAVAVALARARRADRPHRWREHAGAAGPHAARARRRAAAARAAGDRAAAGGRDPGARPGRATR